MLISILEQMNHWHWLALGLVLLAGEILGTAGYLLWLGISAVLVGLILSILPISWHLQWVCFGVFSLVTTWLWWRRQLSRDKKDDSCRNLNQKEKQLIGQTTRVEEDILAGDCRIRLGDTTWSARCDQNIASGSRVKVIDVDGIILFIQPID